MTRIRARSQRALFSLGGYPRQGQRDTARGDTRRVHRAVKTKPLSVENTHGVRDARRSR
nr:MAG TPA: hypothetical protein [Caudoviricetes sp.]